MTKPNKNNGITMIALVVTVIVLMIIAGISAFAGTKLLKTIKIEEVQTNLISIRSKAKGIAEEINAMIWTEQDKVAKRAEKYKEKYSMEKQVTDPAGVSDSPIVSVEHECYEITKDTLEKMGLSEIFDEDKYNNGERYYVVYDTNSLNSTNTPSSIELDVIYGQGVTYKDTVYYSLAKMQEVLSTDVEE